MAIPNNEVLLSDFTEGLGNFNQRFRLKQLTQVLTIVGRRIDQQALTNLLNATTNANAITFYHGLRNGSLHFGLRATRIDGELIIPELDTLAGSHPTHRLKPDGLLALLQANEWATYVQGYYADLEVDRAHAGHTNMSTTDDPKCITFPWSDITALIDDMSGKLGPGESATLAISPYAMIHREVGGDRNFNGPHGLRLSVCLFMQRVNADNSLGAPMLNDHDLALPTSMYGLNLGYMCPPKCKRKDTQGTA